MRVLVACDSFKESSGATEVCRSIAGGLRQLPFDVEIDECPLADGGEGMLAAIGAALELRVERVPVSDPLALPCEGELAWLDPNSFGALRTNTEAHQPQRVALLEAASVIGLARVPQQRRNPLVTSSYGLGQLMKYAFMQGATTVVVGLGGTATVDAGLGLAQALGARFPGIPPFAGGGELARVSSIDLAGFETARCHLILAADVTNPVLGARGAARAFGPQKGASAAMVEELEIGISQFARQLHRVCAEARPRSVLAVRDTLDTRTKAPHRCALDASGLPRSNVASDFEAACAQAGAGAAGGLGFALQQLFESTTVSGVELVMQAIAFERRLRDADVVITGEGRLDQSSFEGKVISGVLARARSRGIPVVAIVGSNACSIDELRARGVTQIETLVRHADGLADAKARVNELLGVAAARIGSSLLAAP